MKKIKIKGTDYAVGFSFRAIKNYEEITGKSISECSATWDNLVYFYSTLKALNEEFKYSFEEFTKIMDEEPELLIQFQAAEQKENNKRATAATPVKKKVPIKHIFALWMLSLLLSVSLVLIPIISIIAWTGASLWLLMRLIKTAGNRRAQ